jgi:hypothetical protein
VYGVEIGILQLPELDIPEASQRNRVARGISGRLRARIDRRGGGRVHRSIRVRRVRYAFRATTLCNDTVPFAEFDFKGETTGRMAGEKDIHVDTRVGREHILRTGKDVVNVGGRDDAKSDLAIDAAKGHVVDLVAEGRNIGTLGRVYLDNKHVFRVLAEVICELKRERREATFIFAQRNTINPNRGRCHHTFKIDKHTLSFGGGRSTKATTVG